MSCCGKSYKTPFGTLKGDDLETAETLYLYFYDMVNDGMETDYADGRNLYADPFKFFRLKAEVPRANVRYDPTIN